MIWRPGQARPLCRGRGTEVGERETWSKTFVGLVLVTSKGFSAGFSEGFPAGSVVKNLPANAGDVGSIPGSGRSSGGGNGNLLQYSCLGNSMGRGAWQAAVHGVTKGGTGLSDWAWAQSEGPGGEPRPVTCTLQRHSCLGIPAPTLWNVEREGVDAFPGLSTFWLRYLADTGCPLGSRVLRESPYP